MDRESPINKSLLDGPMLAPPSSSKKDKHSVGESSKKKKCSIEESSRSKKRPRETTPTPPQERSPQRPRLAYPVADEQPRTLAPTISASPDIPTIQIPGLERRASEYLANKVVGLVGEHAWDFMKRHFGYLIFYKGNIKDMENKFGELDHKRKDVDREVETAYRERLEEVKIEVQAWLDNVKKVEEEVTRIRASVANNNGFLHFRLHYTLGSQAADQIQFIDKLLQQEREFNGVSHSPPPPSTTGSLLVNEKYAMFESRKLYINEILDALKDEAVHMIGVYGMGGIGKTTLVKEVAKQAKKDDLFTEVVMVTVSQNLDVKRIQTGIAESLRLELNEETVEVRAGKIEGRLDKERNRVLVIFDDLWEMLELSKVRIPDLNKGTCRVVITSRREDVCDQMDCQKKVELRTMSDEESWLLFKNRAGNVVESPTMKEVAWDVAKQCAGLPLALVVLGTALKGKKLEVWKTVLKQLKKSTMALDLPGVSNKVRQSIELSYNFLESEAAKWCFLHCCLYPEDYDIDVESEADNLMHMLVGGGLLEDDETLHEALERVHVLMNQLKASCLLLEGKSESYVRMHDVVRDVAIWIGERDHGFFVRAGQGLEVWPRNSDLQNCRRISLMYNTIDDLPSDPINCTKLETLILSKNSRLGNIPEKFFQHMGALKVLDLSYTKISCLPESLSCLTSLRVLNLKECWRLQDISPINGLKMLEILILEYTRYPGVHVVPKDTGGLLNLRLIDLGNYESTTSFSSYFSNVLRGCSRLEQLLIPKYEGCLVELASLRFLTHLYIWGGVVDLDSNDSLSHDLGSSRSWTNLQEFLICFVPSGCKCLLDPAMRRRSLHLTKTKLFSPLLKALLEKIKSLALVHCQESEVISSKCDIPPHVSHNLTQLLVSDCLNLTSLGDEPLLFQLKSMRVENCPKLARLLPSKMWTSMNQLEKLEVARCVAMLQLFPYDQKPMAMTELLPNLVNLNLSELPQVESVLQTFQRLPNLMVLQISGCGLKYGLACHEMEMAADPFPKLEKLEIYDCMEMSQMISSSSPDALQGRCIFQNLTFLTVDRCPRLTHLFWSKQANLRSLRIQQCGLKYGLAYHEMEMVVDPFPKLEQLYITRCFEMSQMISSSSPDALRGMCIFQNLSVLTVYRCPRLTHLFWSKQAKHMQQLTSLDIRHCDALTTVVISNENQEEGASTSTSTSTSTFSSTCMVVDHHGSHSLFPRLTKLILHKLPHLESVLQPFQCLPNLMELEIWGCGLRFGLAYHEMERAADPFPKLKKLKIQECMEMIQMISSSSPDALQGMCIFQNLSDLYVAGCPRLPHLFWSKQAKHIQQLTSLEIYNCESLTAVVISNENQEEGASTSTSTTACPVVDHHGSRSFFPLLIVLILFKLPKMTAFHQPRTALPMEWPCLEEHFIGGCPKLETPLLGPQTSERSRVLLGAFTCP